jgi:HK97 family phage prohead protease
VAARRFPGAGSFACGPALLTHGNVGRAAAALGHVTAARCCFDQGIDRMEFIREFSGYAIEWNCFGPAGVNGEKTDTQFSFAPGCFDESLIQDREICLTQDCMGAPIFGRRSDGTLSLRCDDIGLIVTARLLDTPANRLLSWKIDNQKIRGWSHCWEPQGYQIAKIESGRMYFEHFKAHLGEVSLVVSKYPRMKKTAPVFLAGGPKKNEAEYVL